MIACQRPYLRQSPARRRRLRTTTLTTNVPRPRSRFRQLQALVLASSTRTTSSTMATTGAFSWPPNHKFQAMFHNTFLHDLYISYRDEEQAIRPRIHYFPRHEIHHHRQLRHHQTISIVLILASAFFTRHHYWFQRSVLACLFNHSFILLSLFWPAFC